MPEREKDAKPEGWEKLRRHNSEEGPPEEGFDPKRRQFYSVRADKSIAWTEKPPGGLTAEGLPRGPHAETEDLPTDAGPPEQVRGTTEQPASIPGVEVARAAGELKTEEVKRG